MSILFLGNDPRQIYACEYLNHNHIDSTIYSKETIQDDMVLLLEKAEAIALPSPVSYDGININQTKLGIIDIINHINENSIILGGMINENIKKSLSEKGIKYFDYFNYPSFQIKNALLSAEGSIHFAKCHYKKSIYGSNTAIFGFGRIGKILAFSLKAHGADVCICARKSEDIAWSDMLGFKSFNISESQFKEKFKSKKYDIIFNTVPCNIINEDLVKALPSDTMIIDIASYPYGIDKSLAEKYNLDYHIESGIPGRYAPQSAGILVGETIMNIIYSER